MMFPESLQLQRLADKMAMVEQKAQEREKKNPRGKPKPVLTMHTKPDPVWEGLRQEISQFVPELHDIGSPDLIRSVYTAGILDVEVLKSLAALSLTKSREAQDNYNQHILTLAQCLAQSSPVPLRKSSKLALVRTMMTLRSPLEVGWQLQEGVIQDTLQFITDREYTWEYLDHFDEVLLWELRAITLMVMEQNGDEVSRSAADVANQRIKASHGNPEEGVTSAVETILQDKTNQDGMSSEKVQEATAIVRRTSRGDAIQTQSTVARDVQPNANRIRGGGMGENIRSHHTSTRPPRYVLREVGIASRIGQVAATTANAVEYKYGPQAGRIVRNANHRAGNIFRNIGHVTRQNRCCMNSRRAHGLINDRCLLDELGSESSSSEKSDMFAETDDDMFQDVVHEIAPENAQESQGGDAVEDACDVVESHEASQDWPALAYSSSSYSEFEYEGDRGACDEEGPRSPDPAPIRRESTVEFDTKMAMSPEELDSCLPDRITSVDAKSDFYSDITNEPKYERNRRVSKLLNHMDSSRNSIFRNLDKSAGEKASSASDDCCKKGKVSDDDDSSDDTACTMEETYITNSTFLYPQDEYLPIQFLDEDDSSQVSGFETNYEAWATGSGVSSAVSEGHDHRKFRASRIPESRNVMSESGVKTVIWQKELFSSVKTKLGL